MANGDAACFHEKIAQCKFLANQISNEGIRQILLAMAEEFRAKALAAEATIHTSPTKKPPEPDRRARGLPAAPHASQEIGTLAHPFSR